MDNSFAVTRKKCLCSVIAKEIFNYLQSADRHCIVAIDEFQTIATYPETNVEALIRTYVQQCRNAVFVFSGSQKSMMSEMFSSPARPFYQSVSLMFLKPVALTEYELFAKRLFEKAGKQIDEGVVRSIYERFDGTTWYLQKMLNQRNLLAAISCERKATKILSMPFVRNYHLASVSSVQKAASILLDKQLITRQQDVYEPYDKFMGAWLRQQFCLRT